MDSQRGKGAGEKTHGEKERLREQKKAAPPAPKAVCPIGRGGGPLRNYKASSRAATLSSRESRNLATKKDVGVELYPIISAERQHGEGEGTAGKGYKIKQADEKWQHRRRGETLKSGASRP